jgi:signal transduction histidine kinase/ligand-binding sensor domain-containing protein
MVKHKLDIHYFKGAILMLFLCLFGCSTDQNQQKKLPTPTVLVETAYQPMVNALGDTIPTGVERPLNGKTLAIEELMDIKVVPAGEPEIIPAHPNRVEIDRLTSRVFSIDEEALPKLSEGDIEDPLPLVNAVGDTIPTGEPIRAIGKVLELTWPKSKPALQPKYLDKATIDIKYLDVEHGLSSSYTKTMIKDSRGNFWIGTYGGGISVYDGATFRHFSLQEGLPTSIVLCLMEDSKGRIWIGSNSGLMYFDGKDLVQFPDKDGYASSWVVSMLEDDEGHIWFGSQKYGLSKYDGVNFYYYQEKEGCKVKSIDCLELDSKDNIWIGNNLGGLTKFDGNTFTYFSEARGLTSGSYSAIHEDRQGNLWFGTLSDGMFIFNGNQITQLSPEYFSAVFCIKEDKSGNLWIGSGLNGLSKYDGKIVTKIDDKQGLNNNKIYDLLIDDSGKIFLSTYGGISIYNPYSFQHPQPLSGRTFRSIFKDKKGNLWFGADNDGVYKYDGRNYYHFSKKQGLGDNNVIITAITEDQKGNIWFGARSLEGRKDFLIKYDGQVNASSFSNRKASFTYYDRKGALDIGSVIVDKFDNVWIGYGNTDILRFDGKSFFQVTPREDDKRKFAVNFFLVEDQQGDLWLRTLPGGVIKINLGTVKNGPMTYTHFGALEGLTNQPTAGILPGYGGNIWIHDFQGKIYLSEGGGDALEPKTFRQFDLGKIQDEKYVFSMMLSLNSQIWVMLKSNAGLDLLVLDPEHNFDTEYSASLAMQDGLKSLSFSNYRFLDSERLWLTTSKGISYIELDHFWDPTPTPGIFLSEIKINAIHQDFNNSGDSLVSKMEFDGVYPFSNVPVNLQLPYDLNDLSFYFAAIDWSAPHKIRYSYLLEGVDKEWSTPNEEAYANFQRLPYGDYTLKVRAYGKSKEWSDTLSYTFEIHPPWWLTWWAKIFYVVLVILAVIGLIRLRTRQLKKRSRVLEDTVQKRTLELKKTILELKQAQAQLIQSEKMASLGLLTAGIAHEINNPVSFTQTSTFALDRDMQDIEELIKKYRNYMQSDIRDKSEIEALEKSFDYETLRNSIKQEISDMKEGNKRIVDIVKSLREFSHEVPGNMEPADIHHGIETTLRLLKNRFNEQILLTKEYDTSIGEIKCNLAHLNQVFMNLLTNALDAVKDKGKINIATKKQGKSVKIAIKDNGKGIPKDDLDKIFDPFFTTKKIGQGTGLGLSISHKIISDHGGTITAISNQNEGTVFTIVLNIEP